MAWFARSRDVALVRLSVDHAEPSAELHARAFAHGWSALEFERLIAAPSGCGLAALERRSRDLVGFILSRVAAGEAEILTVAVDPAWRRLGIGRRLVDRHLVELERVGVRELFLEVDENNGAARALYAALRFTEVGRRAAYYRDATGGTSAALVLRRAIE